MGTKKMLTIAVITVLLAACGAGSKKQNEMYSNFTQGLKSKYTVEKA